MGNRETLGEILAGEEVRRVQVAGKSIELRPASGEDYVALQVLLLESREDDEAAVRVPLFALAKVAGLNETEAASLLRVAGGRPGAAGIELLKAAYDLVGLPERMVDGKEPEEPEESEDVTDAAFS